MITVNIKTSNKPDVTVETRNIVPGGTPALATAIVVNTDEDELARETIPAGGEATIEIGNSTIRRANGTTIAEVPATDAYTVANSSVQLVDANNTPISTTPVQAASTGIITAPNGTVTAKNSQNASIGSQAVTSNGTANLSIGNSTIKRANGTTIAEVPATDAYTVANSIVNVQYQNGTPISTNEVQADSTATINVPNPPDLTTLVGSATNQEVFDAIVSTGKETAVQDLTLAQYGPYPLMLPAFGTFNNAIDTFLVGTNLYVLNSATNSLYSIMDITTRQLVVNKTMVGNLAGSLRINAAGSLIMVSATNIINIYNASDNNLFGSFAVSGILTATFIASGNIFAVVGNNTIQEYNTGGSTVGTSFNSSSVARVRTIKSEPGTNRVWVLGDNGSTPLGRLSHVDSVTRAETSVTVTGLPLGLSVGIVNGIAFANGRYFITCRNGSSAYSAIIEITLAGAYVRHTQILSAAANIIGISAYSALPKLVVYIPTTTGNSVQYAIF